MLSCHSKEYVVCMLYKIVRNCMYSSEQIGKKADSVSLNNKHERKTTNNKLIVTSADPLVG